MTEQTKLDSDSSDHMYNFFSIGSQAGTPIQVNLTVNQKPLTMELDTGASYSLISEQMYKAAWLEGALSVEQLTMKLHTYTDEQVVVGLITVTLCYNAQVAELPLLIVKGEGPSLFGHVWILSKIKVDWCTINQVTSQVYEGGRQIL